ncbi:right-handed parallel beta-helix repeat-containing protein [Pontiellaceae bacterium B12219]|nr:right-handed parallel beta-helix repeat-containing protein [Pontiellaceae bacterium B12219]
MMRQGILLLALFWGLFSANHVTATAYFVNKQGSDTFSGLHAEQAFLTIQRGLDALTAGDSLTIGPGEYAERVEREDLGSLSVDTIIRAELSGTVFLRGDVPAPDFQPVAGYRFVYAAPFALPPQSVLDHNQLRVLFPKANVSELEFEPGFFHYDAEQQMLYISNRDFSGPEQGRYTVSITDTHGFALKRAKRVLIEGISTSGFHPGWGILLTDPEQCVVRDCRSYLNTGGIQLGPDTDVIGDPAGSDNLIDNCICYGNSFGGIVRYGADNDTIQNCCTYKNVKDDAEHFGIMHYSTMHGALQLKNNRSWGHNYDFSVKPGGQQESLENCVGLGYIRINNEAMYHNLLTGQNEYGQDQVSFDNIRTEQEEALDENVEFADPLNLDFRLQADSRFRNAAPDGSDRGPYSYEENIFYLAPTGSDQADGLSLRTPWKTLTHALNQLAAGDTLYLSEGSYAAPLSWEPSGDGSSPIKLAGRGHETVIITNALALVGGTNIRVERLHFSGGVSLDQSADISFNNCTFFDEASGVQVSSVTNLLLQHSVFVSVPITVTRSEGLSLTANIFANTTGAALQLDTLEALRYADYNNYQEPSACWQLNGVSRALADLQPQYEIYSQTLPAVFSASDRPLPVLSNSIRFKSIGPGSTAMGHHHEYSESEAAVDLIGPFLHSAFDTTANLEWWCSYPANFEISWGETPALEHKIDYYEGNHERFNTISLTNLTPSTTYYVKIDRVSSLYGEQEFSDYMPTNTVLSFTTAAAPAPARTLYVAPDGHDANEGTGRATAFKTLAHAADVVAPGDTVLIAGGEYNETIRMRVSGTPEAPITFKSLPDEKVVHLSANVSRAFELISKSDYRVDGIYFDADTWREGFVIRYSPRVHISRCFNAMVYAVECPDLRVKNSVLQGGWSSLFIDGVGEVEGRENKAPAIIENNVFIMTILRQVESDWPLILRNNIFCECLRGKAHQQLLRVAAGDMLKEEGNNCFYVRWPEHEKLAINDMPLYKFRAQTGTDSFADNPMMNGARGFVQGWFHFDMNNFDDFLPPIPGSSNGISACNHPPSRILLWTRPAGPILLCGLHHLLKRTVRPASSVMQKRLPLI